MMNEFLDNYEVLGGKMRPVLPGQTPIEKLDNIRKGLGEARIQEHDEDSDNDDDILMPLDVDEKVDRWDCETILSACALVFETGCSFNDMYSDVQQSREPSSIDTSTE